MLLLRPYRVDDREACLALFDSNVPEFFAPHEREGFRSFLDELERSGVDYFVIVDGERPIACGGVGNDEGEARMCWGIVDVRRHREGLGRLLLLTRLVRGAQLGARRAGLETISKTAPFFEREGFVITGGEDDHYGPGLHRRDLVLPLDSSTVTRLVVRIRMLAHERVTLASGVLDDSSG